MKAYIIAAALVCAATPSFAQSTASSSAAMPMMDDATFVRMATQSNMTEVAMGELALQKSSNGEVRKHAGMMVADHQKAQLDLNQMSMVKASQDLDAKHQGMVDMLKPSSDMAFDKAYVEAQIMAHDQAIMLLSGYAQNGSNADMKQLATRHLGVVQEHKAHTLMLVPVVGATVPKS